MRLQASPVEIRDAGKRVVTNADSYQAASKGIFDVVEGLRNNWQGADNQSFVSTVEGYKDNINALGQVVGNYGVFLQETGNSLEKLQAGIADEATRL